MSNEDAPDKALTIAAANALAGEAADEIERLRANVTRLERAVTGLMRAQMSTARKAT